MDCGCRIGVPQLQGLTKRRFGWRAASDARMRLFRRAQRGLARKTLASAQLHLPRPSCRSGSPGICSDNRLAAVERSQRPTRLPNAAELSGRRSTLRRRAPIAHAAHRNDEGPPALPPGAPKFIEAGPVCLPAKVRGHSRQYLAALEATAARPRRRRAATTSSQICDVRGPLRRPTGASASSPI